MLLALVLLAQQALPVETAPVRSLVRVPAGRLALATVNALELDVATVRRTGEVEPVAGTRDKRALTAAGIPFTVVHEDLAGFYASRLESRPALLPPPALGAWLTPPFGSGSMGGYYPFSEVESVLDQI